MPDDFKIIIADWNQHNSTLQQIRKAVFIDEQSVPVDLEWDEFDIDCTHFLISSGNQYIATARIKRDGQIGRMAVLKEYRHRGAGSALLDYIIEFAIKSGHQKVFLHSQLDAIDFYQRKGFEATGDIFLDANIRHQAMFKNLCY